MRKALALLLAFAAVPASGQEPPKKEPVKPRFAPGDAAPALKVSKWLQGEEIKEFDKDKVYVIEFWATWCVPCIRAMPHLDELQTRYKDKGLVVIGLTSKDDRNSAEKVTAFVQKKGKKFGYRFAWCDDDATDKAYMQAAEQGGIPCSFVIGRGGNLAYVGHPYTLDDVLPKVLEGTWKPKEDGELVAKVNTELEAVFQAGETDPAKGLEQLAVFEKAHPEKSKQDGVLIQKFILLCKAGRTDDARAQGEALIALSQKRKVADPASFVAVMLTKAEVNPKKELADLAVKAADAALAADEPEMPLLVAMIDPYLLAGDKDKAKAVAAKAVAAAENDEERKQVKIYVDDKLKAADEKK